MKNKFSVLMVVLLLCAMMVSPVEAKGRKNHRHQRHQTIPMEVIIAPVSADPLTTTFEPGKPASTRPGINCQIVDGRMSCW